MSDKPAGDGAPNLEEQLREMLRKANLSFVMNPMAAPPRGERAGGKRAAEGPQEPPADPLRPIRDFKLKPREIRAYLDRFVIRQDEAKKVLAVAICDHYNHVRRCIEDPEYQEREYAKHNILFVGPTGVGKTYMMRCAARLIGVPFVKADATKFSETGYVGHDVEDLVRDLVKAADGDVDLAQYGIIFLDEIDKIASQTAGGGKDVSGRGVQINLLKLMEETDVSLFSQTDLLGQMQAVMDMQRGQGGGRRTINTRHILFIVSGAFDRLADQVKLRLGKRAIGFADGAGGGLAESEWLRRAVTRDFMDYGFEAEFIGRLPVRVVFDPLATPDLEEILLNAEGSVLKQYEEDFEGYGIALGVDREAVRAIAERAALERTGARGLMTVLERLFREYKFELPSSPIRTLAVTRATVEDPAAGLQAVMTQTEGVRREALRGELEGFVEAFAEAHGLKLVFAREAIEALLDVCLQEEHSVRGWIEKRFKDIEYGFKLIARNTGKSSFTITRKFIDDPAGELSRRIAASFKAKKGA